MSYCLDIEVVFEIQSEWGQGFGDLIKQKEGLLHSALQRPMQEVFNIVVFPTAVQKAAALLQGVAQAHAFANANKRTAWTCCTTFLELNGMTLGPIETDEVVEFVVGVVEHKHDIDAIVEWLLNRLA